MEEEREVEEGREEDIGGAKEGRGEKRVERELYFRLFLVRLS